MVQGRRVEEGLNELLRSFFPHSLNTYYTTATDLGTECALVNRTDQHFYPFERAL